MFKIKSPSHHADFGPFPGHPRKAIRGPFVLGVFQRLNCYIISSDRNRWCPDLFVMGVCETVSVGLDSNFTGVGACFSDSAASGLAGESLGCSRMGGKYIYGREYAFCFSSKQVHSLLVGTILAILQLCTISFNSLDKTAPCAKLKVVANH